MPHGLLCRLTVLLAFGLYVFAARAEDEFARGMLDRQGCLAAAGLVTADKYPDADEVLVGGLERIRYAADGTYTQWHEEYIKILTEKGRRHHLTVASHFTIPYQRGTNDCKIPLVEIVKPDGRCVAVDVAAQSRVAVDSGAMSANIYNPNDKLIQVNVVGPEVGDVLEIGDVLHFVMFDRIVQPRMKDTWCDLFVLESERPIVRSAIEITAPAERPLRSIAVKDEIKGAIANSVTDKAGSILYRWEVQNVPRMFVEPNMPPLHTCVQRLLVSTVPDWQSVSRWYWQLSEPHYKPTPALEQEVAALTRGLEERRRKIEALFTFVSQRVRYMGITVESEAPGYEPHDVKDTFEARHGVCRDKAALLAAMLRVAGFEAFPTLIDVGPKKDMEVAQPYFNHAIVAVREPEGKYLLMDPTDETTTELLPAYLDDKSYLVASPDGEPLRTSPIDPAENNLVRIETRGRIDDERRLHAESVLRFEGINDNAYRGSFARGKAEDRRRFIEAMLESAVAGARVTEVSFSPADMTDVSTTLTVRVAFEADDALIGAGRSRMLPLPRLGDRVGVVNHVIGQTGLKERKYALTTDMACGVQEHITLDLGQSVGPVESLPVPEPFENASLRWQSDVRHTGTTVEAAMTFCLKAVEFPPAEYRNLKDTLKKMELAAREMPIFGLPAGASAAASTIDAVVLDEFVVFDLEDAQRWKETRLVRKKILTYAGKKQNAEVKVSFNTGWEDVHFERGTVTSADGKTKQISDREVNLMDAPWVGSARRYPAGKTLVASLPAVDVGSTIEYCYTRTCTNRPFFAAYESFRSFDPIVRKTLRIEAPAGLLHAEMGGFAGVDVSATTNVNGRHVQYEWIVENVKPNKREDMLPPWWSFNPTVFASGGKWAEYAKAVNRTLERAAAEGRAAAKVARRVTADAKTAHAKLTAIRDYMATHVRETEPDLSEMPLARITPADGTLSDGYGNSADRAVLFSAMLTAAGFSPEFVLASMTAAVDSLGNRLRVSPAAGQFKHVLVRVKERAAGAAADSWIYLNDTDQYAALGATPHAGKLGMRLPSGEIEEIVPLRCDAAESLYQIKIEPSGETTLRKRQSIQGNEFAVENKRFSDMTPEERRRYHQELIALVSQGAEATSGLVTDFSGYPGTIEFAVRIPAYAVVDGWFLYFLFPESLDDVLNVQTDTRSNPLLLPSRREKRVRIEAAIPDGYRIGYLPPEMHRADAGGAKIAVGARAAAEAGKHGQTIAAESHVSLEPAIVPASRYQELLDLDAALSRKQARTVLLTVAQPAAASTNAPASR